MEDLAMTCSDFVNAFKMLMCSEKHLFLELTIAIAYTKYVAIDRWPNICDFISSSFFFANLDT